MFLNDSACNLASLNLMKFRRADGTLRRASASARRCGCSSSPRRSWSTTPATPPSEICRNSHDFRPLGLGYANLGALLMSLGLPYDSDAGRAVAGAVTAIMTGTPTPPAPSWPAALGTFPQFAKNRQPMLQRHAACTAPAVEADRRDELCPPGTPGRPPRRPGTRPSAGGQQFGYRNAQVTRAGAHRHHRLHDGLRHHRHRAGHRPGQVQAAGRRRHVQDRQPHRAAGAGAAGLRRPTRSATSSTTSTSTTPSRAPRPQGRAPGRLRLRLQAGQRHAQHPLHGPHPDDGGRPAVPLRRDLQDRQHAARNDRRGDQRGLHRGLEAGPQGRGHLPRRLQAHPAAERQEGARQPGQDDGRGRRRRPSPARTAAACRTPGRRSRTSSTSPGTRATSTSGCTRTARPASCSSPWPRKAPPSAA